jgi:PHD/YefM family antitoxin component YafN of YafNO toxin-antitoxin module
MAAANIELTEEQQRVLQEADGYAEGPSYVVMSKETYRRMMGIETEKELRESLAAIERGLADIDAGRVRPLDEFLTEFKARHGISS